MDASPKSQDGESPTPSVEPPSEDEMPLPRSKPCKTPDKRSRRQARDERDADKRPKTDQGHGQNRNREPREHRGREPRDGSRGNGGRRTRRIVVTGRELDRLYASDFFQIFSQFGIVVGVDRFEDEVYVSFDTEGGADRAVRTRRLEIDGMAIYASFGKSDRYRRTTEEGRRPRYASRHEKSAHGSHGSHGKHGSHGEHGYHHVPVYGYGPPPPPLAQPAHPHAAYGPPAGYYGAYHSSSGQPKDRVLGGGAYGDAHTANALKDEDI